ncbi:MAG: hypothetical protein WBD13_18100 [Burkholderiaceae bacterium]
MNPFRLRSLLSRLKEPVSQGIVYSLALHGLLMSVHFAAPEPLKLKPLDSRLEVILVNAESRTAPVNPEVVAQVNMEAGGDRDKGRATSPLQAEAKVENGQDIVRKRRKVADLEAMQRQLMTMARSPTTFVESQDTKKKSNDAGNDSEDIQFVIARLQAQIAKNISDYNKRPKRLTYGVNAVGANYARYVTDWAARIEEIGTERYPPAARGKFYDSLVIMVEIQKDGHVGDIQIKRKSKFNVLNKVIKEIVLAGAPYEQFTKEMAAEGDILQIVRTWTFTNRSLQTSSAPAK